MKRPWEWEQVCVVPKACATVGWGPKGERTVLTLFKMHSPWNHDLQGQILMVAPGFLNHFFFQPCLSVNIVGKASALEQKLHLEQDGSGYRSWKIP